MAEYVLEFCSTCAIGPRLMMMQHTMAMVPNSASALMMGMVCTHGKIQVRATLIVPLPPVQAWQELPCQREREDQMLVTDFFPFMLYHLSPELLSV